MSNETVGHSQGFAYQNRSINDIVRDDLDSDLQKARDAAFLEIMSALKHGLTPASSKLLYKRYKHLAGE